MPIGSGSTDPVVLMTVVFNTTELLVSSTASAGEALASKVIADTKVVTSLNIDVLPWTS